jgi:hypothetical protein
MVRTPRPAGGVRGVAAAWAGDRRRRTGGDLGDLFAATRSLLDGLHPARPAVDAATADALLQRVVAWQKG